MVIGPNVAPLVLYITIGDFAQWTLCRCCNSRLLRRKFGVFVDDLGCLFGDWLIRCFCGECRKKLLRKIVHYPSQQMSFNLKRILYIPYSGLLMSSSRREESPMVVGCQKCLRNVSPMFYR